MPRRTIRKPTRWTPEEWARVEDAARWRGLAPLAFVREAATEAARCTPADPLPPTRPAGGRDEVVIQLGRVLNNLRQLSVMAEIEELHATGARIDATASVVEAAIRAAPAPGSTPTPDLLAVINAGVSLNQLAREANTFHEVPLDADLFPVLADVEAACRRVVGA